MAPDLPGSFEPPDPRPSILCAAELPSFGSSSLGAGITTQPHWLISAPISYSRSFNSHKLMLTPPPIHSYQSSANFTAPTAADGTDLPNSAQELDRTPSAKRRKLTLTLKADSTIAEFHKARAVQEDKLSRKSRTDLETEERHGELVEGMKAAWQAVRDAWLADTEREGWMGDLEDVVEWVEKDRPGKEIDWVEIIAGSGLTDFTKDVVKLSLDPYQPNGPQDLVDRIVYNDQDELAKLKIHFPDQPLEPTVAVASPIDPALRDEPAEPQPHALASATLVLPPQSAFFLSPFDAFANPLSPLNFFVQSLPGIDLVVLDPPWPNASVARAGAYDSFDPYQLGRLDLKSLLGNSPALVAVWLTNKVKYRRLVIDKLFPQWGVKGGAKAEWNWIKVTDGSAATPPPPPPTAKGDDEAQEEPAAEGEGGEPVWDWDSTHRRCYEGLVIGQYDPTGEAVFPELPSASSFLSTPLGHSRKPVLLDLLRPYLPHRDSRPPNVLEFFARTALAGPRPIEAQGETGAGVWVAVGNEAVKFNVVDEAHRGGNKGWLRGDEDASAEGEAASWTYDGCSIQ